MRIHSDISRGVPKLLSTRKRKLIWSEDKPSTFGKFYMILAGQNYYL